MVVNAGTSSTLNTKNTQTITLSSNTSWYLYNFRTSTIRRLVEDGYRVVCLSPEDDYSRKLIADLGCEWQPLVMDNKGSNPFRDAGLVFQFWRYYKRLQPVAALHFTIKNNVYGTWAARSLGVPAINNISGLGTAFIRSGLIAAIVRLLYKTSQPFAHRVFCQNEEDLAQLVERRLVAPEQLELLPGSGVNLDRFHPSLLEEHPGPFRFLYAGRMLTDKGLNELIAAVRAINANGIQSHLWLSGFANVENVSSISHQQLEAWGGEPGIEWLGPSGTMEQLYGAVDCVVLPSYREGMPRSLLEAGAMGLPVIATDVPGCRNIVEDGVNGLLCEAKNSESLQLAMQRMLTLTPAERSEMGRQGRTLVSKKFDEQLVVEATLRAVVSATKGD
jgi:glycosyltransferase involved in cell wall biosynthesis